METKKIVIGISGNKGAGKDTAAKILQYILYKNYKENNLDNINYEDFRNSEINKLIFDPDIPQIIHFADKLKDVCSLLFGINRTYFDNRDLKDKFYYCINSKQIEKYKESDKHIYINSVGYLLLHKDRAFNSNEVYITLRVLLQFVGTNVCQNIFGKQIWINSIIDKINFLNHDIIIPDVRFIAEADAIIHKLDGNIIEIFNTKYNNNDNNDVHQSETEMRRVIVDKVITWDGENEKHLFYELKNYIYETVL